jgi:hypothetical protein
MRCDAMRRDAMRCDAIRRDAMRIVMTMQTVISMPKRSIDVQINQKLINQKFNLKFNLRNLILPPSEYRLSAWKPATSAIAHVITNRRSWNGILFAVPMTGSTAMTAMDSLAGGVGGLIPQPM